MPTKRDTIAVLASFYGEAPYLKDFLDSLAGQTFQDFRLLYRFDGTPPESVQALVAQYVFATQTGNEQHCGIPETYWKLMFQASGYPYVMFADQDDVWHPDKIEKSVAELRRMEKQYGRSTPLLVHSDLTVVNAGKEIIEKSLFAYQSLDPRRNRLKDLMIQNNVTGCTMIFNRALAEYLETPVPAICHDWYLALIASAFGKIGFIREPLIDYRQHSGNYYGALPVAALRGAMFSRKYLHERLELTQKQALLFLKNFYSRLSPEQIRMLEGWSGNLSEKHYWKRLAPVLRYGFRKNDWQRTIGMWWAL